MMNRRTFCAGAVALGRAFGSTGRIRAVMIGTAHGHAASKARALRKLPEYDFAGICRVHADEPDTNDAFQGLPRLALDDVLADASIEMVAIETRVERNLDYAERAVHAGKFVHLDKPPGSADLNRLRTLFDDARRGGRVVQMGYQWRYHPAMRAAIEAARNGWLGEVYALRASIDKPLRPDERRELAKFKGGILFEEGCHLIDRTVDLFGKPKRVTGYLQHASPLDDGLADNTLAILEYDKAIAEIRMASFQPHGNRYRLFELSGTNGKAAVQPYAPQRLLVDLQTAAGPYRAGEQILEPAEPPGPTYAPDFEEMARIIREHAAPSYSSEHDLMVQETLLRACGMN